MKYWNYRNEKPFDSQFLEKFAVEHSYSSCNTITEYLFEMISDLHHPRNRFTERQRGLVNKLYEHRRKLMKMGEHDLLKFGELELNEFLPSV
jgi:rRNA pseudouridine-1189 N-methylase Emg1 (Nep1/Mra1 family)